MTLDSTEKKEKKEKKLMHSSISAKLFAAEKPEKPLIRNPPWLHDTVGVSITDQV